MDEDHSGSHEQVRPMEEEEEDSDDVSIVWDASTGACALTL